MIKVVRIIARLNIGGPAIHAVILSAGLSVDKYKSILVAGSIDASEGDMSYYAREKGVEPVFVVEMSREISLLKDFKAFLKIFFIIRREKPDIVHTHTAKAGTLGRVAAILAGVPVKIHTFHGHVFDGYFSPLKARIFVLIERFLALFTDRVIVVSESVRDEIVDKLKIASRHKCQVVRLGFELDKFLNNESLKGRFRGEIGVSDDTILVGIVGRLVPIKNHKMFLEVVKKTRSISDGLKIKFVIVGDGELKADLIALALSLGVSDDVIFTGWVKDLEKVYADLDVVALISLNEGTPVSLIEAMASARAVISSAVGGVKDIVNDNGSGVVVPPGNSDLFVEKLVDLIKDGSKRERMGIAGRNFVRTVFSKERLVSDIEQLYEACVNKRG